MRSRSVPLSLSHKEEEQHMPSNRNSQGARRVLSGLAILLALFAQSARADALKFFNNWFVTGDYAVAGTGLATSAGAGTITMAGVPAGAYPVAAFLYWEAVESTTTAAAAKGTFNGFAMTGQVLGSDSTSACWVTAPSQTLRVYRADVLRFLPIDTTTHVRRPNGNHTVALGGPSGVLAVEGASLVVIYRVVMPGNPGVAPLRSIVIYDGAYTVSDKQPSMTQNILGFYQASSTNPAATMTHIVGNANAASQESLKVNGSVPNGVSSSTPFVGAQGRAWDNLSFSIDISPNASKTETKVVEVGNASACLSWGAVVTAVNVQDSDGDGLLDFWEKNGMHRNIRTGTFGGCADFPTETCINLPAMGAVNGAKDVFVQLDWMHGYGDGSGGVDGSGLHSHVPKLDALSSVANAFAAQGIALHFDVGNNYQGLGLKHIIPYTTDSYGHLLAQGGSDIDEATLVCHDTTSQPCAYHEPYPVLSFKLGFASVKDGNRLLNIPQHFAPSRRDIFHYGLFAHAVAGPFDLTGKPATVDPKSISGIGDRPGGDLLITLGLWRSDIAANDMVGSTLVQAGTLMHELGHNLGLSHAGGTSTPNCAPSYPSVMSYLYQTRGLTDANGVEQIDYSKGVLAGLNENAISATTALGASPYRVRYYGPFNAAINSPGQIAKLHCDGTPILDGAVETRLEAPAPGAPDWSNGLAAQLGPTFALDVNFDGILTQNLADFADWSSLNFQQIGSRGNFGSISTGSLATDAGSLATDAGSLATDAGSLATDAGSLATDAGSLATDAGSLATDAGSLATDAGSLATDAGSLATDAGDEDYDSHIRSSTDRIPSPQQCTGCGLFATNAIDSINLRWTPPETGVGLTYNIYRCTGAACTPLPPAITTLFRPGSKTAPTYTDTVNDFVDAGASCPSGKTCYNTVYTYSVTAVSAVGVESPYSNLTVPTEVTHLFVVADSPTIVYGDANPAPSFKILGDIGGALNSALVTCSYNTVPRNAGAYPVTCAGPVTASATDGVTYNAPYLTFVPGVLTIKPRPLTVTAGAASKIYDGNTWSTGTPTITSGALQYSDSVVWTESYDNRNAGTTHVMTPAGMVSDGNGGANYVVTFVPISDGVILPRPITVSAAASTKVYDGTTSSTALPTITVGSLASGDSATWTETYDNRNVGTAHVMSPGGTVSDGNGGNNYAVTLLTIQTGVITARPITVTASASSKEYDGTTSSSSTPLISVGLLASPDTAVWTETYDNRNVGTAHVMTPAGTVSDGNGGSNYTVTLLTIQTGVITPRAITVTAGASTKQYDGNTSSTGTPAITAGALLTGDTAPQWTETYDNRNVGTTHTMTPAGVVSDGNGGNNYAVTYATISTGVITARPITVTASPSSKTYDGNTSSSAAPAITSGSLVSPDSATWTESYDNPNVGSTHVMTPAGVVSDGNGGKNYAVTGVTISTGVILNATATIVVTPYSVTYDGNAHAASGAATGVMGESLSAGLNLAGTAHTDAGTTLDSWSFSAANYWPATGSVTDVIAKANAAITVTPYNVTYDGNAHTATGSAIFLNFTSLPGLDLSKTTHTAAGVYTDPWKFSGGTNYNDASGTITDVIHGFVATGSMNVARSFAAAALLPNGKVLVAGGFNNQGNPLNSAEVYDPATGQFAITGSMTGNTAGGTATLLGNGLVLVAGGGNASALLYDQVAGQFSPAAGMGVVRTYHTAVLLPNGKVLVAGGSDNSGKTQSSAQLFDPATKAFTATGSMTVSRDFHTATLLPDGRVLITGGRSGSPQAYTSLSSAEIYDPSRGTFRAVAGSMSAVRFGHTAVLCQGRVLIAGGASSASADLYDPTTGTFSSTGSMATSRQYATSTVTALGVLEAGGSSGVTTLASAELYQGGAFAPAGSMTAARAAHTATVLSNGWVLLAGGKGAGGAPIATAELFK
jgi:hypothetical protein